jgi:hypothetical protein
MDIWGILGGVIVSLASFVRDIRDSRIPLIMRCQCFDVVWYEDNCAIVVFHLSFVNDSSQKRTVGNVEVSTPLGVAHKQYPFVTDAQEKVAICRLPTDEGYPVPTSELLQVPLDIPPRQSAPRKTFAVYLQFPAPLDSILDSFPYEFAFFAWKPRRSKRDDKPIARDSLGISPNELRTLGAYAVERH